VKKTIALNDNEILSWVSWLTTEACELADLDCEDCLLNPKTCAKLVDTTMDVATDRQVGYGIRARKLVKYLSKIESLFNISEPSEKLTIPQGGLKTCTDLTTSMQYIDSQIIRPA
jgi:hypothetical protein